MCWIGIQWNPLDPVNRHVIATDSDTPMESAFHRAFDGFPAKIFAKIQKRAHFRVCGDACEAGGNCTKYPAPKTAPICGKLTRF